MGKVVILGSTGMLGAAVVSAFKSFDGEIYATRRKDSSNELQGIQYVNFEANEGGIENIGIHLGAEDFIVNCIGIIKPYIKDDVEMQRLNAIKVNSLFPHSIARFASQNGVRIIQIATDCVYSGQKGDYIESDPHDALDVYGKTKSLGEVPHDNFMHLRVSIIGPEFGRSTSLLEWVRNQPKAAEINGFTDHLWNGVPTKHFGKLARGIIEEDLFSAGVQHIVPANQLDKHSLVNQIAEVFDRTDLKINPKPSGNPINRTLASIQPEANANLWKSAGYATPPTVEQLVAEIPD